VKLRIAIVLILVAISVSSAQAQSNCCNIQVAGTQISALTTTVPGPQGGTYTSTETQTTPIACINTANADKPCSTATIPPNVVTATGYGAYSAARLEFVVCNPAFVQMTVPQTDQQGASFTSTGTSYASLDANGNCVPSGVHPHATSTCVLVQCSNSPVDPNPACLLGCKPGEYRDQTTCFCVPYSPIILDISGKGFILTSAANGVVFDISGTGRPIQMGWTAKGADNAFLALPGANGLIQTGKELFGNFTPQPPSETPNGFAALAVYDDPKNGGNRDGVIDSRDAIFNSLRLWIDANHDGISQPDEIYTLPALGVNSISLKYREDHKTDQYGNEFRYRAAVNPDHADNVGRIAYDVFFVIAPTTAAVRKCFAPEVLPDIAKSRMTPGQK
jgi:hypothetical protein